jgi:hypothetical protein
MIYSPSQSKQYLTCPTARMLGQEGWTERVVGIRDWTAWIGQGVHAGLAACLGGRYPHPDATQVGQECFAEYMLYAIKGGRIIPNTFFPSEAKANIERCLEYAMTNDLLPTGFEVERVEQSLGDYNCILDVVGRKGGKPTFIDWKVKNKCKPEYIDQTLETYRYDWKEARHYPWALSEVCGQRVAEYTVVMFILQPFKVVSRTYQVNWKMVERWASANMGSGGLWGVMSGELSYVDDDGSVPSMSVDTWQSNACMGGQWPCEYLDACWTYDLDREKMKQGGLIQVERLRVKDEHGTV